MDDSKTTQHRDAARQWLPIVALESRWDDGDGPANGLWRYTTTFWGNCFLRVEVGTTGRRGGDAGHGGRSVLRLKLETGQWRIAVDGREVEAESVEFQFEGDEEQGHLRDALGFALDVLGHGQPSPELVARLHEVHRTEREYAGAVRRVDDTP